jgi:predicted acyl esterase
MLIEAYRDIWFQGGIPETSFAPGWLRGIQNGRNETEDVVRMRDEHPLLDDLWKIREPDLSAIDVPAFIVRSNDAELTLGCGLG